MITNLLIGLPLMAACLALQALLMSSALQYYKRHRQELRFHAFWTNVRVITAVMLLLVVGNLAQVAVWAAAFRLLGEFEHYGEAFYHSAVNFATLGYGDIVMSARHKLLGPLEAITGALMIGASTATLIIALQDAAKTLSPGDRPQ